MPSNKKFLTAVMTWRCTEAKRAEIRKTAARLKITEAEFIRRALDDALRAIAHAG